MIKIEFISQLPENATLWATAVDEEQIRTYLPSQLQEVIARKPRQQTVEAISESKRLLVAKLGPRKDVSRVKREEAGAAIAKLALEGNEETLFLDIHSLGVDGLDLLTGLILSSWRFDKYRSVQEKRSLNKVVVVCDNPEEMNRRFQRLQATLEGTLYARELTSEPPNVFYPESYAERLNELKTLGIEVEILNKQKLQEIGMTALLAAGQGSCRDPAVAILTWKGSQASEPPIVVVGKGVCFDSGGLCIKSTLHQQEMKWDKAGAGVVAGLIKSLALTNAPVHVVGILGLIENMPDGTATKVGDIIRTMSGVTVEIGNTDAEGRLVLADCVWYGQERFNPKTVIDLGTLTMETFASLGYRYAGLYCNESELTESLKRSGDRTGELVWELPMGPYFAKQMESDVADIRNVGIDLCGENGAAAEFIRRFIKPGVRWAHLDIAGVSWTKEELPLAPKGVTGYGVRLLHDLLNSW